MPEAGAKDGVGQAWVVVSSRAGQLLPGEGGGRFFLQLCVSAVRTGW